MKKSAARVILGVMLVSNVVHAASFQNCPIKRAHYQLSSDKRFSLSFESLPTGAAQMSDVALKINQAGGQAYWFLFDEGSARYINLISTLNVTKSGWTPPSSDPKDRPLGEMHYFGWSGEYKFNPSIPKAASIAPERIFLPDLAEVMAYRAVPRTEVPDGVFVLVGCD